MSKATLQTLPDLVALKAISNGALKGEKLPDRIKVLNWGRNESTKGVYILDDASASVLTANQRNLGFERIALDFEHNTVPGAPEYERTKEPRAVAAYGAPELVANDGLYLSALTWTPDGQAMARNFEDLSPAVNADAAGRVVFIHSAALTRNGAVHGLTFFSAATKNQPSQSSMDKTLLAALAVLVGLSATATEAEVTAKYKNLAALSALDPQTLFKDGKLIVLGTVSDIETRLKKIEEAGTKGIATLSATIDGKTVNFTAEDVVKLGARIEKIEGTVTQAATAAAEAERMQLVTRFSAEGKSPNGVDGKPLSGEALQKLSADTLKMLLANTPVTVPLNARTRQVAGEQRDNSAKGRSRVVAAFERDRATTTAAN